MLTLAYIVLGCWLGYSTPLMRTRPFLRLRSLPALLKEAAWFAAFLAGGLVIAPGELAYWLGLAGGLLVALFDPTRQADWPNATRRSTQPETTSPRS